MAQTGPSIEILPVLDSVQSVARAWVWRESVRVRCYASANAEYETTFNIENDGRQSVTVSLPDGHRLIGLEVQGRIHTVTVVERKRVSCLSCQAVVSEFL